MFRGHDDLRQLACAASAVGAHRRGGAASPRRGRHRDHPRRRRFRGLLGGRRGTGATALVRRAAGAARGLAPGARPGAVGARGAGAGQPVHGGRAVQRGRDSPAGSGDPAGPAPAAPPRRRGHAARRGPDRLPAAVVLEDGGRRDRGGGVPDRRAVPAAAVAVRRGAGPVRPGGRHPERRAHHARAGGDRRPRRRGRGPPVGDGRCRRGRDPARRDGGPDLGRRPRRRGVVRTALAGHPRRARPA